MSGLGPVLGAALLTAIAIVIWPRGSRTSLARARRIQQRRRAEEVASAMEAIAMCLQAGLTPGQSVAIAAERIPEESVLRTVLGDVRRSLARGDPGGPVWERHTSSIPELRLVSGSWSLTEASGTALQPAVTWAAQQLRERRAAAERLEAVTSGARASMGLLMVLPLAGLPIGMMVGLSPKAMYGSLPALMATFVGMCFAAGGFLISRRILARALRPAMLAPDPPNQPSSRDDVTDAALLLYLVLSSGSGVIESLEDVSRVCRGRVRADLARVAAAYRWGLVHGRAWTYADPAWGPVAMALGLALEHGAAPAAGVKAAGDRLQASERARLESAAGRAGTMLLVPLAAMFMPAFALTTMVPLAIALAPRTFG